MVCHSLLQWTMFCQKSLLWPIHLGWPCKAWLIVSLSYARRFTTTRKWSLKVLWTARRSHQSILREIKPKYSLEGLMLKLKLQYFGQLIWTDDSLVSPWCWERSRAKGEKSDRMRWLDSIIDEMNMYLGKPQEMVRDREVWCAAVHGITKSWTRLGDWTTILSLWMHCSFVFVFFFFTHSPVKGICVVYSWEL